RPPSQGKGPCRWPRVGRDGINGNSRYPPGLHRAYRYRHFRAGENWMTFSTVPDAMGTPPDERPAFGPRHYLICFRGIVYREALRFLSQRERFVSSLV